MKKNSSFNLIFALKIIALTAVVVGLFSVVKQRCAFRQSSASATAQIQVGQTEQGIQPEPENSPRQSEPDLQAGSVIISEIMVKNKASLLCGDLGFLDWVELKNISAETVSLEGWTLSDKASGDGWKIPEGTVIGSGEYLVIFAAGANAPEDGLYADFALSGNDTVTLRTPLGNLSDSVPCVDTKADVSYVLNEAGMFKECLYPTPGHENTLEAYISLQCESTTDSPVIINEVASSNFTLMYDKVKDEYPDWIELKNVSGSSVSLAGWCITDDITKPDKVRLPDVSIAPGGFMVIKCFNGEETHYDGECIITDLGLDGENEHLYLFKNGTLSDYLSITGLSYGGTFGRMPGENGSFRFTLPTPGKENTEGFRYMCARPEIDGNDGVFEGVDHVTVTLSAAGDIYYTLDGSLPTKESTPYTEPIRLESTSVIRAICSDGIGIDSRPQTASYIINEGHTVPVISVVGDDAKELERLYRYGEKGIELPGAIEFFEENGSFSIDCGVRMAGRASLKRAQKNLTFKFRGRYGDSRLDYSLFEEGFSSFSALTLRSGQDSTLAVIRNELSEDLCLAATDKVVTQRSKWCVMYLNGQYYGLFALKDKINEDFIASIYNIDKDSVELDETPTYESHEFYKEVIDFTIRSDMTADGNYEKLCSILDIDSFIDWILMEQYTGNFDILYGNTGFFRSTQLDNNRWKAVFYDLDAAFREDYYCFRNFFNIDYRLNVYSQMLKSLFNVEEFRDKYLTRASELLSTVLTNENVTSMIEEMYTVIEDEMPRECDRWNQSYSDYERYRDELKTRINSFDYYAYSVSTITDYLHLSEEEAAKYFG